MVARGFAAVFSFLGLTPMDSSPAVSPRTVRGSLRPFTILRASRSKSPRGDFTGAGAPYPGVILPARGRGSPGDMFARQRDVFDSLVELRHSLF